MFYEYFETAFKPNDTGVDISHEMKELLEAPTQMNLPIEPVTTNEIKYIVKNNLNQRKSSGYDLITGNVLQELPGKAFIMLTFIFNAILRLEYFPAQWKKSQIVVIQKPGKPPHQVSSYRYRPISLLPVISKVFEEILLKRLLPIMYNRDLIPSHQFGFRKQHSTVEQVHRVANIIKQDLEKKQYCSAAFLDVSQAFDKLCTKAYYIK